MVDGDLSIRICCELFLGAILFESGLCFPKPYIFRDVIPHFNTVVKYAILC